MLGPQSRSAVAIGPIAASDTDTALLLRRLRPYLLPVARLPRAPALVRLGHAAACLVGGVAGAVAAPLRRLDRLGAPDRSEEHTSELQSLMRISYAVFCLKKKKTNKKIKITIYQTK